MATVLLVDDERSIRMTFSYALSEDKHEVITAESAEEAWGILRERPIDVVISDIIMPGMHGVALLEMLVQEDVDAEVILMTGYPSAETAIRAIRAGAFDYLPKPVFGSNLRRVVAAAHERKILRAEAASEQDACSSRCQQLTQILAANIDLVMSKLQEFGTSMLPADASWREELLAYLLESQDCVEILTRELSGLQMPLLPEMPMIASNRSPEPGPSLSSILRCSPRARPADDECLTG